MTEPGSAELDALNAILTGKRGAANNSDQADLLRAQGANAQSSSYVGAAAKGATIASG